MQMKLRKRILQVGVGAVAAVGLAGAGQAMAAFPNFSDCPTATSYACINIQSRSGSMAIKGTTVPLGDSLELRAGLISDGRGGAIWNPPRGSNGFYARPVEVPGGLLGIDFPIPGNAVTATAQLAGPPTSIRVVPTQLQVTMPLKLKLSNPILGPWCQIGTDRNPALVDLIVGTTNPPAPNRPITGSTGTPSFRDGVIYFIGATNVDNSFSVPGASNCGIGLGLVNGLIDLKLQLPSRAGNNTLIVNNDVALQVL